MNVPATELLLRVNDNIRDITARKWMKEKLRESEESSRRGTAETTPEVRNVSKQVGFGAQSSIVP